MLLIFFNTVMFLLTIQYWHWKKSSALLFTQWMWNRCDRRCHILKSPEKSFATPLFSPQALHSQSSSSSCSTSSSFVDDSSGGIYSHFLFPPCVRIPPPLFLCLPLVLTPLLCFFCFPLLMLIFPFLFGFFLPFLLIFSSYILMCSSLVKRHDLVTTWVCFCFDWFISGKMNELYKFAGMTPVLPQVCYCVLPLGDV